MGSTSMMAANAAEMRDHWVWRPEWTSDRTCLYWYLTFHDDEIAQAVGDAALRTVRDTSWLDAVPPRWSHVTVADVGFTDELDPADIERVTAAVADAVAGEEPLRLALGPVQTFASAVVLATRPLDRLRAVKTSLRRATAEALGPLHTDFHRRLFWPHVSLGYVNRDVDAVTASELLGSLAPISAHLDVDALTLAAVTRRDRHYEWAVRAQVDLPGV